MLIAKMLAEQVQLSPLQQSSFSPAATYPPQWISTLMLPEHDNSPPSDPPQPDPSPHLPAVLLRLSLVQAFNSEFEH